MAHEGQTKTFLLILVTTVTPCYGVMGNMSLSW